MNYDSIYQKVKQKYQKRNLTPLDKDKIKILINQAITNYQKLPKSKFCTQKSHISLWIHDEISKDIAQKSLKPPIHLNHPPNNFKATAKFYKNYSSQFIKKQKQVNLVDKKNDWIALVKERNRFALDQGYKSRLDMALKNYQISQSEFNNFLKSINKTVNAYKKEIYSTWNPNSNQNIDNFCLICNTDIFPFTKISNFLDFFEKKNVFYKKNKNKIVIELQNESKTDYIKETDTFKITLNKNSNTNHQILDLIHELSHVISMAEIFKKDKFITPKTYYLEKLAIKNEIIFLKKYFPKALTAKKENLLRIICQTLFEIEIYQNPHKDPNKTYLKYLKKCSKNVSESDNWNYLSNQDILYKTFSQLIYAVAYTNELLKFL